MARKKTTRKAGPRKAATQAALPKGFDSIGGFGKSWPDDDTKIGEAIQGVVTEYHEDIKTQHGKTSNLKLESKDGEIYTVWNSAALNILFDEDYTDVEIWLRFDGLGKKKGKRNPAKLFTLACKE